MSMLAKSPLTLDVLIAPSLILLLFAAVADAQGTRADYDRAKNLRQLTENKVFKTQV